MNHTLSQLTIKVMGNVRITGADGSDVRFTERRGQALLVILAVSDGHRRSRHWLKATLWPRSPEPQCSSSLRQTLHALRLSLGPCAGVLKADRSHVWLEDVQIDRSKPTTVAGFYEDAPLLDEPFDDWLRQQSAIAEAMPSPTLSTNDRARLCIGIAPPVVHAARVEAHGIADLVCDQVTSSLRYHELLDVFDLRELSKSQLGKWCLSRPPSIELLTRLSVIEIGTEQQLGFQVMDPETGEVVWSMSLQGHVEGTFRLDLRQLAEFTAQVVDAIHTAVERIAEPGRRGSMLAAVHEVISHTVDGQRQARKLLSEMIPSSGLSQAWIAYTFAVAYGERHGCLSADDLERADYHCRQAVELDPSNPLVRALVAHVNAFVLKDYVAADEHVAVALRHGPNLAMAWRSAALYAHYTGNAERACEYSARAHRLGRFSPYQGVYSTCYMIALATSGQRRKAIGVGQQILNRRPGYLAAMRHLSACYALEGDLAQGRRMVDAVRAVDERFTPSGIRDPRYPLPSDRSVDLVTGGFAALGIAN